MTRVGSPFEILGVDRDADEAAIVRAYRQRVKDVHPDHGGTVEEFKLVQTAYEEALASLESETGALEPDSDTEPQPQRQGTKVEFLNYQVLDDRGWDLDDDDLFEKAADADLDPSDYGQFLIQPHEYLLEGAENRGFSWPYACRGGACANCAVAVVSGEMEMPSSHVLSSEMVERGYRLSCISGPTTDAMQVVFNLKHLPELEELRLPAQRFDHAQATD
jgi:ferredoxin